MTAVPSNFPKSGSEAKAEIEKKRQADEAAAAVEAEKASSEEPKA